MKAALAGTCIFIAIPQAFACQSISRTLGDKIADEIATRAVAMESLRDAPRERPSVLIKMNYGAADSSSDAGCLASNESKIRSSFDRRHSYLAIVTSSTSELLNDQLKRVNDLGVSAIDPQSANRDPKYLDTNYVALISGKDTIQESRCAIGIREDARVDVVSLSTTETRSADPISHDARGTFEVFSSSRIEFRNSNQAGVYLVPPSGAMICPRNSVITVSSISRRPLLQWTIDLGCSSEPIRLDTPDRYEAFNNALLTQRGYVSVRPTDRSLRCGIADSASIDIRSEFFPRSLREGLMPGTQASQCFCGPAPPWGSRQGNSQCAYGVAEIQQCQGGCYPNGSGSVAVCILP